MTASPETMADTMKRAGFRAVFQKARPLERARKKPGVAVSGDGNRQPAQSPHAGHPRIILQDKVGVDQADNRIGRQEETPPGERRGGIQINKEMPEAKRLIQIDDQEEPGPS